MMIKKIVPFILAIVLISVQDAYSQGDIPPKLIYPTNQLTLQEPFPTLSWTRALPANLDFEYDLKIVEILPDQSPEAAILANPEWYAQKGISRNLVLYPVTAPLLLPGKRYAWQVIARHTVKNDQAFIRRVLPSEVFWFTVAEKAGRTLCKAQPMKEANADNQFYILDDFVLRFHFDETVAANKFSYRFLDSDQSPLPIERKVIPERVDAGAYYQIPLKQFALFRQKAAREKFYYLEATATEGEKYYIKFTYK